MKRSFFQSLMVLVLLFVSFSGCAGRPAAAPPVTLTVMAAASLTESFQEIGKAFEAQHAGVTVQFNFAGSQQLASQLSQGAAADVFASANQAQMDVAVKAKRIAAGSVQIFAQNRLVVIFPKANPANITTLKDLAAPGHKLVLADKAVPVGQYALTAFQKASQDPAFGAQFSEQVLQNVVSYEENVKAVLTKVSLGEADAGVVYSSDVSAAASKNVGVLEIPDAFNSLARYPIAAVDDSQHAELARAFVEWVRSPGGQTVLQKYGFLPPQ